MIVLQTLAIYLFLFVILRKKSLQSTASNSLKPIIAGIFIYAIIFGLRYGVGTDHLSYLEEYLNYDNGNESEKELGFSFFTGLLANNGIPSWIYFAIISFFPLFLVYKSEENNKYVYPYLAFIFIFDCIWLTYSNGLRQVIALSIFIYSIKYISSNKVFAYYLLILIAFTFHSSAALLLIIYPLKKVLSRQWIQNVYIQIIIITVAAIIGQMNIIKEYVELFDKILELTGYSVYSGEEYYRQMVVKDEIEKIGIGYVIMFMINILNIIICKQLNSDLKSDRYTIIYNLYFVGCIVFYVFNSSLIVNRINMYFYGFSFIISAYTLYYSTSYKQSISKLLYFLHLMLFVGYMYRMFDNDSAFYFIWQSDMYRLAHPNV